MQADGDEEEQGRARCVGGRADEVAMVDLVLNLGGRVAGGLDGRVRGDEGVEVGGGRVLEKGDEDGDGGDFGG